MGIRGELYSTRVGCEGRTYFFNVKENRMGDVFLTVVESKPNESEGFERRSVVVFKEDMPLFLKAFQGALDFMSSGGKAGAAAEAAAISYDPPPAPRAARPRTPGGFAGKAVDAGKADSAGAPGGTAPRKKIVVKRKSAAPKDKDE